MTQEEKELLLRDLCTRLPYQPICEFTDTEDDFCTATAPLGYSLRDFIANKVLIKPYLRSLSKMTDEESKEFSLLQMYFCVDGILYPISAINMVDWLNAHHFDYRDLIPIGLALEAPEGMYKID